jgi:hypothetical protein
MLREAESVPMTTEAIAARIVADKGLDPVVEPMVRRVAIIALKALRKRELAASDDGKRWAAHI